VPVIINDTFVETVLFEGQGVEQAADLYACDADSIPFVTNMSIDGQIATISQVQISQYLQST
jgi:hypothetical protein